jgi:hypothetical protein
MHLSERSAGEEGFEAGPLLGLVPGVVEPD